jgi:hypothetical protein
MVYFVPRPLLDLAPKLLRACPLRTWLQEGRITTLKITSISRCCPREMAGRERANASRLRAICAHVSAASLDSHQYITSLKKKVVATNVSRRSIKDRGNTLLFGVFVSPTALSGRVKTSKNGYANSEILPQNEYANACA